MKLSTQTRNMMESDVKVVALSRATLTALTGIADLRALLLELDGDTVPVGRVLRELDNLQMAIVAAGDEND